MPNKELHVIEDGNVLVATDSAIRKAYGCLFTITGTPRPEWLEETRRKYPNAEVHEVAVEVNGERRNFTYADFFARLGFPPPAPLKVGDELHTKTLWTTDTP